MPDIFFYTRLQTGCLVFLLYIGFLVIKGKDENTKCNVFSDCLYYFGILCVIFDGLTAWSVNMIDSVSMATNIVLHGIFYLLLETELWFMYFYFRSIVGRLPKTIWEKILFACIAGSVAAVTLITLPDIKIIQGKVIFAIQNRQ